MRPRRVGLAVVLPLLLALSTCGTGEQAIAPEPEYTLVQLNLCLSGRAQCYPKVRYPAGVRDAVAVIRRTGADAVTLSEVCRSDVEQIAADLGYQARFAPVASYVLPDDCVDPGGRGVFGMAVLTRAAALGSTGGPYSAQDKGIEQRRWLCVTTDETQVCTTHLEVRGRPRLEAVNDAQCREFAQVLRRLGAARPLIAAGDLNRDGACSAPAMWIGTDRAAEQAPGKQQAYADQAFGAPQTSIVPMAYSDHDALVVTARLQSPATRDVTSPTPARR
jgi:endonuclease/exonuclease/phosphatase family metal-dependent hydrolase